MQFAYTAKAKTGDKAVGVLAAESLPQAQRQLRQQGLFVVSIAPVANRAAKSLAGWLPKKRARISHRDILAFTSQLAIMTKAGIDIAGAILCLARQCPSPHFKTTLEGVYQEVVGGKAFSAALNNYVEAFGNAYVASVAAGEA